MFTTTKDSYLTKHNAKGENIHLLIVAFTCLTQMKEIHQEKQEQNNSKTAVYSRLCQLPGGTYTQKTTWAQYSQKAVMEIYLYAIKLLDQINREEVHRCTPF